LCATILVRVKRLAVERAKMAHAPTPCAPTILMQFLLSDVNCFVHRPQSSFATTVQYALTDCRSATWRTSNVSAVLLKSWTSCNCALPTHTQQMQKNALHSELAATTKPCGGVQPIVCDNPGPCEAPGSGTCQDGTCSYTVRTHYSDAVLAL
jgi:hypothetical protein